MAKNGDDRDIDKECDDLWNRVKVVVKSAVEDTSQRIDRHVTQAIRLVSEGKANVEDVVRVMKTVEKIKAAQMRAASAFYNTTKTNLED